MRTTQILRKSLQRMTSAQFKGFLDNVVDATSVLTDENLKDLIANLQAAFGNYQEALALNKNTNNYTKRIHEVSETVDTTWRTLKTYVTGLSCGPESDTKTAAEKVLGIIAKYGLGILNRGYSTKFGTIALALVHDFSGLTSAELTVLNITGYFQTLYEACDEYIAVNRARNNYRKFIKGKVAATRKAVNTAYYNLVDTVEIQSTIKAEGGYDEFIGLLNEIVISERVDQAQKDAAEKAEEAEETEQAVEAGSEESADTAETVETADAGTNE